MTGLIYAGLVNKVIEFCENRGYDCELLSDFSDTEFSIIEAKQFITSLNLPFEPHDYQIESFIYAVRKKRTLIISPTGSGKSLLLYLLCMYFNIKTLIIVPNITLVNQLYDNFYEYGYKGTIHKIFAGKEKYSDEKIFLSTWQSIFRLDKEYFNQFQVVFADEAHLVAAQSLTKIFENLENCSHRYGLSGTLDDSQVNELVLTGIFGDIKKIVTTSQLIDDGHLSQFKIKCILLNYSKETKKLIKDNKFDYQKELDYIVTNKHRNKFIKNLALSLTGNTIVLFNFVEKQGKVLYELIKREATVPVFFISGTVSAEKREEIRKFLLENDNCILVSSVGTTATGLNIPNLSNCIFCSPSKSKVRNLQSIGRILRNSTNKDMATLFDLADDLSASKQKNITYNHFIERLKLYQQQDFNYKIYKVNLNECP